MSIADSCLHKMIINGYFFIVAVSVMKLCITCAAEMAGHIHAFQASGTFRTPPLFSGLR